MPASKNTGKSPPPLRRMVNIHYYGYRRLVREQFRPHIVNSVMRGHGKGPIQRIVGVIATHRASYRARGGGGPGRPGSINAMFISIEFLTTWFFIAMDKKRPISTPVIPLSPIRFLFHMMRNGYKTKNPKY